MRFGRKGSAIASALSRCDPSPAIPGDFFKSLKSKMSERSNPLDMDGGNFDVEAHLRGLLKTKGLGELLDAEHAIVQEVRSLDSEMQTLVYENYSKFITATDTIRKMKADFVRMEDEMDALAEAMANITTSAEKVSDGLSVQRAAVAKVATTSKTLEKVSHLSGLPSRLEELLRAEDLTGAAAELCESLPVLERAKERAALAEVYAQTTAHAQTLKERLRAEVHSGSTKSAQSALRLLLRLGESPAALAEDFLTASTANLRKQLHGLQAENRRKRGDSPEPNPGSAADTIPNLPVDILEFVDVGASSFLSDIGLAVAAYGELFPDDRDRVRLQAFADPLLGELVSVVGERFTLETNPSDSGLVVRALDRFYRRYHASLKVVGGELERVSGLVLEVSRRQVDLAAEALQADFLARLKDIRQQVAAGLGGQRSLLEAEASLAASQPFADAVARLETAVTTGLKTSLASVLQFCGSDVSFAHAEGFQRAFAVAVRQRLLVAFFRKVVSLSTEFCEGKADKAFVNSSLLLLLSRFAKNMEASTCGYLMELCEQQVRLAGTPAEDGLTPTTELVRDLGAAAQSLLDRYVSLEGASLSALLVKSVEARDWASCVEPRSVRAVMKRVVEDLTLIEAKVLQVYPDPAGAAGRKDGGASDSSRRTAGGLSNVASRSKLTAGAPGGQLGSSALRDRLGKLWSERIDYFGSVDFSRAAVMEGLLKISLKTLLESIRLRSFNSYGAQQVQVDAHYLEVNAWRFVADEALVHGLLEEVVGSALERCPEPTLMEPKLLEHIAERA